MQHQTDPPSRSPPISGSQQRSRLNFSAGCRLDLRSDRERRGTQLLDNEAHMRRLDADQSGQFSLPCASGGEVCAQVHHAAMFAHRKQNGKRKVCTVRLARITMDAK